MRKKLVQKSPYQQESRKRRRNFLKRRVIIYSFLFLLIFFALAFLSRWSKLNIRDVIVQGNTVTDSGAVEDAVKGDISGNYLFLFPKANFLIYPKAKIADDLQNKFKILKDISVSLTGVNTLSVSFTERVGKYTWCGSDLPPATPEKCYFMDDGGYIFGEAPYFSGGVYLKFYGAVGKANIVPLGYNYFPDLFPKLLAFRDSLKNMGISASSFFIKPDNSVELYLSSSIPFPNKPKIIFKSDFEPDKAAENLQTALTTDPLKTEFTSKFDSLQYIDLRYGNKVYYKFN